MYVSCVHMDSYSVVCHLLKPSIKTNQSHKVLGMEPKKVNLLEAEPPVYDSS